MRFAAVLLIAVIFAMTCNSCLIKGAKHIKEGEIYYTIDYAGSTGSMPKEVLPKNLILSFKNDKILFEMMSPIGNSGILNLSNPSKGIYDTYLSMFTIKYYYAAKRGEMYPGFEGMADMEVHKTERTAIICGFNCKNAEVTLPLNRKKIYDIWYTDEIDIRNPNICSPFYEIDGVLMSFFLYIGHYELRFNAETVYRKDIPDEIFERRDKFIRVSRQDIIRFIDKMLLF